MKLSLALVEYDIAWENPQKNYQTVEKLLKNVDADVILLPEMFATGFSMNVGKTAESMQGESVTFLTQLAQEKGAAVCGTIAIQENEKVYNRLVWAYPNGNLEHYDKRHLFSYGDEHEYFDAGNSRIVIGYKGFTFCPMVCYDLRFPVWCRNNTGYDVLFFLANWPEARIDAWEALLKARAIENMAYVAGVNRIGVGGNELVYPGKTMLFDPMGKVIESTTYPEGVLLYILDKEELLQQRDRYKFLEDRDQFEIK